MITLEFRHFRVDSLCALAIVALFECGAAHAQVSPKGQTAAATTGDPVLEEVVVTAQRRAEKAQDVPIAITAFTNERLEQLNIVRPGDLQGNVPSLVVGNNGGSNREAQVFTIRGQGSTFQASPGVVVYLNEVPLPAAVSAAQQGGVGNYLDLENLQVLNGPQGTLFGRNTTGGAVLLVPNKPTNDFDGYVQTRIGNYNNHELEGVVNIPIVNDKVLLRVAGAYQDRDGYTKDVVWNLNRDDVHYYAGRVGLTIRPNDSFENYTMFYGSNSHNNGTGLIHRGYNIAGLAAIGFCYEGPTLPFQIASCDVYRAADANAAALGPRATAYSNDVFQRTQTWGLDNTSTYKMNDAITLRNIFSYQRFKTFYTNDPDATVLQQEDDSPNKLPAPGQVTLPGDGTPITYLNTLPDVKPHDAIKVVTEELQLQGNALNDRLTYTVGGFYFDSRPTEDQVGDYVAYCPAAFTGLCGPIAYRYSVQNGSRAVYGQSTLDLGLFTPALNNLKLTGGYRYTWDTVTGSSNTNYPSPAGPPGTFICTVDNSVVTDPSKCAFGAELKSSKPTWTIGLDDRLSRDLMLYAKVSRGYKSGGFNTNAVFPNTETFAPEVVTSYEGGFKSNYQLGEHRTLLNATLYYLDYANIQRAAGDFNPETGAAGAKYLGAAARIQGIEVETSFELFPGVYFGGNYSYTDAKYTNYEVPVNVPTQDCSGQTVQPGGMANLTCLPFQYVAPVIFSVHLSAERALPSNLGTVAMLVNYAHTSSEHTEGSLLPPGQPGERLEAFGTLNASLDWRKVAGSGVDIGIYATNLTNELYRVSNSDQFQTNSLLFWNSMYGEPRMYGVRLRYGFGK